jgi:hypothetical protein
LISSIPLVAMGIRNKRVLGGMARTALTASTTACGDGAALAKNARKLATACSICAATEP